MNLDIFENIKFFSVLAFRPWTMFLGTKNIGFWKQCWGWRYGKTLAHLFPLNRQKWGLSDMMMSYIIQRMSFKGCHNLYLRGFSIYVWMGDSNSNTLYVDVTKTEKNNCSTFLKDAHPHVFTYRLFESIFKNMQIHLEEAWVSYLTVNPLK